jgi:hypothetical protein
MAHILDQGAVHNDWLRNPCFDWFHNSRRDYVLSAIPLARLIIFDHIQFIHGKSRKAQTPIENPPNCTTPSQAI